MAKILIWVLLALAAVVERAFNAGDARPCGRHQRRFGKKCRRLEVSGEDKAKAVPEPAH